MGSPPFVDRLLPRFVVQSEHGTDVRAAPPGVYESARRLDLGGSRLIRFLFRLRGIPADALDATGLGRIRMKVVIDEPPVGYALGVIGMFWKPAGGLVDFDPGAFVEFEEPGYAKAVWSFDVTAGRAGTTRLRTVTRVACTDEASRRKFLRYWRVVGPFSGLVRREALRAVRNSAERSVGPPLPDPGIPRTRPRPPGGSSP